MLYQLSYGGNGCAIVARLSNPRIVRWPRRRGLWMRDHGGMWRWVLVVSVGVLVLASLDPATLGLSLTRPFAQVIALRAWVAIGWAVLAVLAGIVAVTRRLRGGRPLRTLVLVTVLAVAAGVNAGVVGVRGTNPNALVDAAGTDVTVMSLNTLGGQASVEDIRVVVDTHLPDVVALVEAPAELAHDIAGDDYQVFVADSGVGPVGESALLVSDRLSRYRQVAMPDMTFGTVRAEPVEGDGPVLAAVHPPPPVGGLMDEWRADLTTVTALCESVPGLIMAGDFNATRDHAPLRRCTSALAGAGGMGTWPTSFPSLLGAPIDHVVVDPGAWEPLGARVFPVGQSDHRGVVAVVRPVE